MKRIKEYGDLYEEGGADVIEVVSGQCIVVQCNHDVGRSFIRSMMGETTSSICRVAYRGTAVIGRLENRQAGWFLRVG